MRVVCKEKWSREEAKRKNPLTFPVLYVIMFVIRKPNNMKGVDRDFTTLL